MTLECGKEGNMTVITKEAKDEKQMPLGARVSSFPPPTSAEDVSYYTNMGKRTQGNY